jgi:hypothetical protein
LGLLTAGSAATAQNWTWYPAINPDYSPGSARRVENTGNEHVPLDGQTLRVMCWDGDQPQIGWSFSPDALPGQLGHVALLGNQFGTVTDPDIVADPGNFGDRGGSTTDVLVAYMLDGAVCCEVQRYNAATNQMVPLMRRPMVLATPSEKGSNPNVDVDGEGHAVVTWSQDMAGGGGEKAIYVQTYHMPTQTFYPRVEVAGERGYDCTQPDVAIYHKQEQIISVIYIVTDSQGEQTVRVTQVGRLNIEGWPTLQYNFGAGVDVLPGWRGRYDAPRIAAPVNWPNFEQSDFQAVVMETTTNQIVGLNMSNYTGMLTPTNPPTYPTVQSLNHAGGMDGTTLCSKPVVSFCADAIEVAWTMEDVRQVRNGDQEVVHTFLNWYGTPANMPPPNTWYSIVNQQERGNQRVPSVAGRYAGMLSPRASSSVTNKAFYCFVDENSSDILFKSSLYFAQYLRTAATPAPKVTQPLAAYPNPFQEQTTLTLTLAKGETVQSLQVVDAQGQPVRGLKLPPTGATGDQQVHWNAAGLKPGLYLVQLRTSTGALHTYRVQHE